MNSPIAITGLGLLSPVGVGQKENWHNLSYGKSGISQITDFDITDYPSKIAGSIIDFNISDLVPSINPIKARKMDLFIHYGLYTSYEAIRDAQLPIFTQNNTQTQNLNPHRIGVCMGSAFGGVLSYEKLVENTLEKKRVSPFAIPSSLINMLASQIALEFGYKAINFSAVSACASSSHAIISGIEAIQMNQADIMIVGGAEAALSKSIISGFSAAKSLSKRNDNPQKASRPWDKDRDGFVLANGAASLVLESLNHAQKRGAKIYALITGYGANCDAYHITSPIESGQGASLCMNLALKKAKIDANCIDYINAHGTSTQVGDLAETKAIYKTFGKYAQKIAISSTKSMTGHLLGAAGAYEAAVCALSLKNQMVTPTINLDNPDPDCDLDYVPHQARSMKLNNVLSNSFGFGGVNACLIFSKFNTS